MGEICSRLQAVSDGCEVGITYITVFINPNIQRKGPRRRYIMSYTNKAMIDHDEKVFYLVH